MPVHYVGRANRFIGKPLYEILARLKGFGIGRLLYRHTFMSRYPEPTFYLITKVEPDMTQPLDSIDHRVVAHKYFRGEYLGEHKMRTCYKSDWRLVPREEETALLNYKPEKERPRNIIPDAIPFPPLLERMMILELEAQGKEMTEKPMLPISLCTFPENRAVQEKEAKLLGLIS